MDYPVMFEVVCYFLLGEGGRGGLNLSLFQHHGLFPLGCAIWVLLVLSILALVWVVVLIQTCSDYDPTQGSSFLLMKGVL